MRREPVCSFGHTWKFSGELLGELSLAIEFMADVEDIALTTHAHPTLNETVGLAAELAAGTVTDVPNPAARKAPRKTEKAATKVAIG